MKGHLQWKCASGWKEFCLHLQTLNLMNNLDTHSYVQLAHDRGYSISADGQTTKVNVPEISLYESLKNPKVSVLHFSQKIPGLLDLLIIVILKTLTI